MALGPVDVIIIGFPGNRFTGRVAPALMELVESKVIRVLDLLFVHKDADGTVTTVAATDLDPDVGAEYMSVHVITPGALNEEDAEEVGDDIPRNSSALLVAFENSWAAGFVAACRAADGVVIDQIRIPSDVAEAVLSGDLATASLTS